MEEVSGGNKTVLKTKIKQVTKDLKLSLKSKYGEQLTLKQVNEQVNILRKMVKEMKAESVQALRAKDKAVPDKSATVQPREGKETLDEKKARVKGSDLSVMQKAIVESLLDGTDDAQLLIGAMKIVEGDIIDEMAGTTSGNVVSDLKQDDLEFFNRLGKIKSGYENRLSVFADGTVEKESVSLKLEIVEALLRPVNKAVAKRFFNDDIEPKVVAKKLELRGKIRK